MGKFCQAPGVCTEVACKEYMVSFTPKHCIKLLKEINCLKKLQHSNILQHFGIDFTRSLLVTELLEKKIEIDCEETKIHNARELLDLHEIQPVPWDVRMKVMLGFTSEISFLHENSVIHCDLKARNIFIGGNEEGKWTVKLGDFGSACYDFEQFSVSVMPSATNKDSAVMCTAAYTAPELLERGTKPSLQSDMSIKKWISTFYTNSESSVLNNGFCTNYFKLSRGVRQGCPLSPYLFILAAEVLATRIRQDKTVRGITIFGTESKISQFADDTSAFCDNLSSVQNLIRIVNDFGTSSGLKLNAPKT